MGKTMAKITQLVGANIADAVYTFTNYGAYVLVPGKDFSDVILKQDRNSAIIRAFRDGYTQM